MSAPETESKPDLRFTKDLIEMRRARVLELLSKGLSGADISRQLNVSKSLICLDIQAIKSQAQEQLRTHIQETIPFEYQKSKQAITDLIRRTNEMLDAHGDDPKIALSIINTLTNLLAINSNLNSEANVIQQAYDKVSALEEIQKRRSSSDIEEAVFSEADLKDQDVNPDREPTKITTIDDQEVAPEPEEEQAEGEEEE